MKTNTTHTPGPWSFSSGSSPHYQAQIYGDENGRTLAITYSDEAAANAALIAAAPELLDALQAVTWLLLKFRPMGEDSETNAALSRAQAAIERATR